MRIKKSTVTRLILFLGALGFAGYLALLPVNEFIDRDNYFSYIKNSELILEYNLGGSFFYILANEPLWLVLNQLIGYFFYPEEGVRLMIFVSALLFYFFAEKEVVGVRTDFLKIAVVFVLIAFSPQIVKNFVIHLRQGVALAIFFLLSGARKSLLVSFWVSILAAQFHSSFYFLSLIFFGLYVFDKLGFEQRKSVFATCIGILALAPFLLFLSIFFEARQGVLAGDEVTGSGAAFVFWLVMLFLMLVYFIKSKDELKDWRLGFAFCSIVLYLSLYYSFSYAGRVFETCLPIVFISLLRLPVQWFRYFAVLLAGLFTYQWLSALSGQVIFRLAN